MSPAGKHGPGGATRKGRSSGRATGRAMVRPATASGRYTPPIPRSVKVSPRWMGPLILALLMLGALMIVLNYFDVLPSSPTNWYLLGGIAMIAGGFVVATQYH
ncbi:MAG TPA: cell division protein CrgA [Acidimicrobiales bacterium]|nr:cell division protein CrgA [Acidimicrobiales bacterium]